MRLVGFLVVNSTYVDVRHSWLMPLLAHFDQYGALIPAIWFENNTIFSTPCSLYSEILGAWEGGGERKGLRMWSDGVVGQEGDWKVNTYAERLKRGLGDIFVVCFDTQQVYMYLRSMFVNKCPDRGIVKIPALWGNYGSQTDKLQHRHTERSTNPTTDGGKGRREDALPIIV